jgi:hypothetical protein
MWFIATLATTEKPGRIEERIPRLSSPPPLMEMSKNPLKRCKEGGMQPMLLRLYTGGYNYTTRLKQLDRPRQPWKGWLLFCA